MENINLSLILLLFSLQAVASQEESHHHHTDIGYEELQSDSPTHTASMPLLSLTQAQHPEDAHELRSSFDIESGLRSLESNLSSQVQTLKDQSRQQYSRLKSQNKKLKQKVAKLEWEAQKSTARQCCMCALLCFLASGWNSAFW